MRVLTTEDADKTKKLGSFREFCSKKNICAICEICMRYQLRKTRKRQKKLRSFRELLSLSGFALKQ